VTSLLVAVYVIVLLSLVAWFYWYAARTDRD